MNGQWAIGAAVAAMALVGGCLLCGSRAEPDWPRWISMRSPTAAGIRAQIGSAAAPANGLTDLQRREQFCTLFKNRYRRHNPPIAVGVRFLRPTLVKLMCPARLEPFVVDRIAVAAWHEVRDDFGNPWTSIYTTRSSERRRSRSANSAPGPISRNRQHRLRLQPPSGSHPAAQAEAGPEPTAAASHGAAPGAGAADKALTAWRNSSTAPEHRCNLHYSRISLLAGRTSVLVGQATCW